MDLPVFLWMFVILKIPIIAALLLIWYAIKEPEPIADEGEGGSRVPHGRSPLPNRPRPPRRGPHATPPSSPPARIRTIRGRRGRRPAGR